MFSKIDESNLPVKECLSDTISLLLSGNFQDAKVRWLSICDKSLYIGEKKDGNLIDVYGTEAGMALGPLSTVFERTFDSSCTSPYCPGFKKRTINGTDLQFMAGSVDPIQEAIATWESGRSKKCPAIFTEEPETHSSFHKNANYGTTQNPNTKYECVGKVVFSEIRFKHPPPVLVFHVLIELSEKISDLSLIPKDIILHGEHFLLGGATVFLSRGTSHFVSCVYHSKTDMYYYFDALSNVFSAIQ